MRLKFNLLFIIASAVLLSCESSTVQNTSAIQLGDPFRDRQILNIGDNPFRIQLVVNGGPVQNFTLAAGQPDIFVQVTGIRPNELNTVDITWLEVLNGFDVEISVQRQEFVASGNVTINATHSSDQFDYDSDGASNFAERTGNGCVWSANEVCQEAGQLDIPPTVAPNPTIGDPGGLTPIEATINTNIPTPAFLFNFDNADDVAVNGDFSAGGMPWATQGASTLLADGETLCSVFQSSEPQIFDLLVFYGELFDLAPGRYAFMFDIWADRESIVTFDISTPNILAWLDQGLSVNRTPQSYTVFYQHFSGTFPRTGVGFRAIRHPEITTTYCIDNFRFYVER